MTDKITTPIVFFPGTLCDERIFLPLWQALNSNGRALDSKAFVPLQWAEDLTQMLALSEDRLDYFPSKVHLFAYSMGGYIAALLALANPDKVASLSLVSSTARSLTEEELQQRKVLLTAIKNKQYKGMSQSRIDFMLHSKQQGSEDIREAIKAMADDLGPSVLAAQTKATTERENLSAKLSKQAFKTHFVVGDEDNIAHPKEIAEIVSTSSQFSSHVFADAGHMLPLEQPEALAKWIFSKLGDN